MNRLYEECMGHVRNVHKLVGSLDSHMCCQNSSNMLFVNNYPIHPQILNLTNVELIFLLPNTICLLEPLDKGIEGEIFKQKHSQSIGAARDKINPLDDLQLHLTAHFVVNEALAAPLPDTEEDKTAPDCIYEDYVCATDEVEVRGKLESSDEGEKVRKSLKSPSPPQRPVQCAIDVGGSL
ncbi:hypothetical protein PR048_005078 [Dryococelus australis]|uniref:DDE-1 domain-containing protein n=1 Tax=Dryococelus australis TaxID=614101 RepID=A0ABQ9I768_9NEOP|nr:hypothetical protein PR048_005078 [Dryococelus australis]